MAGKDQGIEDGFGSAGLGGLISRLAVIWSDLFPKAYTLPDVIKKPLFVRVTVSYIGSVFGQ